MTDGPDAEAPRSGRTSADRDRLTSNRLARAVVAVPERAVLLFLVAVVAVGPLTTFGQFRPALVVPLFVVLAIASWRLLPAREEVSLVAVWCTGLVLLGAVAWIAFNALYRAEFYVVLRDPAIYTLRALWLVHHASPDITVGAAAHAVDPAAHVSAGVGGFPVVGSSWQAQNATLVPALLAVFGWIAGTNAVLAGNLVIGAVALLAVYAVSLRLVGPIWSIAPVLALATSMPMVQFSRAPYTEPTALALGLGGVLFLWIAVDSPRVWLAAAAGLAMGATFMARPDGLLFCLGAALALGVLAALARDRSQRARFRGRFVLFCLGSALSAGLGFVDLARNSSVYESSQWNDIHPLLLGTVAVVIVVALLTVIPGSGGPRRWLSVGRARWTIGVCTVLGVVFVALVFRPFYVTIHHTPTTPGEAAQANAVASIQAAQHLVVDGTRTYDERTLLWLSWYYGWPAVVLAAMGTLLMVNRVWRLRDAAPAALLGVVGVSSALYLNRVNITPDQVWAMRRFLPVVVPGGLILAATVPCLLWHRGRKLVAVVTAALIGLAPIPLWRRTLVTGEYRGFKGFVASICTGVAGRDVLVVDNGSGASVFVPAIRVVCGVPTVMITKPATTTLAAARTSFADGKGVVVVTFGPHTVQWSDGVRPQAWAEVSARHWTQPLSSRPESVTIQSYTAYLGSVAADGTVVPQVRK